jgi:hypothetical protein
MLPREECSSGRVGRAADVEELAEDEDGECKEMWRSAS